MKITLFILIFLFAFTPTINAEEEGGGKSIFEARCGGMCHQLPKPNLLKEKQWKLVLNVMQQRMKQQGQEPLTGEEFETVFDYLRKSVKEK